ncbi:MAG: S8 family serine peptidase, partial [Planctomycetes bacterium]|nr:S8 family serine peptidase [Planctomycetota bacterium]
MSGIKTFVTTRGGKVKYEYGAVLPNVMALRDLTDADVEALKKLPGVVRIEEDMYHPNVVKLDEATPTISALQSQLTTAGHSVDGTGIRVCVCDTGIDMDHTMYSARIDTAASWDFANNDSNPDDDHGHGSHVAGIAVGRTGLSVDFGCEGSEPLQGVAPNATLIGVKILNSAGGGTDSDIIAGIDHCADQSPSGGRADVINLSIGTGNFSGTCTHSWAVACNNAVANGVVVVAASGNENNSNSMGSPACGVDVIAVGATYKDDYPNCEDGTSNFNWGICTDNSPSLDQIVCFSNQSDLLDVAAPGSIIMSASNAGGGTSLTGKSGTSMASPAVAGLAALILDADPTLTPAQVRQIIRDGADDLGPPGFDRAYGYGRVNAINSLNLVVPCSINADCDDGQFCNGSETCDAGSCLAGADPCPAQGCDEVNNQCVAAPSVIYEWNMNSDPGWTMQGQWAYGTPTGNGGEFGGPDPSSGATGSNVIGYNLNGDYASNLAETHLTTTAIDCTNLVGVSVAFERWLGVEVSTYDHAYLRVSNDGSNWTNVWQNGSEVAESSWASFQYDISAMADGQATVFLRWTMGTTDGSWQYCGWNIDDVQIIASNLGGGATCSDGLQNQGEDRIDCGGPCPACTCTSDPACDNGLFCDGAETCDAFGVCQNGTLVDCNDSVGCTADSCNEGTNSCDNTPNNANCDNGLFCDGAETCDAVSDCQPGTPINCSDGVGCTDDSCNEGTNSCDNAPNNASCDNGLFCDGAETCDVLLDCQAGTAVDCNDGVGCTLDSCNEGTDSCDNAPN